MLQGEKSPRQPVLVLGARPFREARLRSYIVRQHRAGRPPTAILEDSYVRRCGTQSFCWRVVQDPRTLHALGEDVGRAIRESSL
jgi:hypothetical protein